MANLPYFNTTALKEPSLAPSAPIVLCPTILTSTPMYIQVESADTTKLASLHWNQCVSKEQLNVHYLRIKHL